MSGQKIAFYTDSDCFVGLEKNILHFMEWLTGYRYEVILVSQKNQIIALKADKIGIPTVSSESKIRDIRLKKAWKLSRVLRRHQINILFVIRPHDLSVAALTKLLFYRKLKIIFIQQSELHLKKHPVLYSVLFRPIDAWIATSDSMRKRAIELIKFNPSHIHYIPPCIDMEYYDTNALAVEAARKLLDLPEGRVIVGTIGKYDTRRKQDFLIRAMQFLHRHDYDVDLLIMGESGTDEENEYYKFLRELVQECQVGKFVHFRPYSDKIVTFFRAIDYFVMNWAGAPYDLILVKAMASGVPILARFSDHNTELLRNGEFGMLYRANDIEDFSSKIIHLLTQPRLRDYLKTRSMQIVRDHYDRKIACSKVEKVIDNLQEK